MTDSIVGRVVDRYLIEASSPDPLSPEEVVAAIKKAVAERGRMKNTVQGVRLNGTPRVVRNPRLEGMFTVEAEVESEGVKTLIHVAYRPDKGAWFQVASIWANGRKQKELDEHVAKRAQYALLLDSLLTHLTETGPGPW